MLTKLGWRSQVQLQSNGQVAALETQTLTDRMALSASEFGKLNSSQEKRAFLRPVVIDIARNEKGTWAI